MAERQLAVLLDPRDNVATALSALPVGTQVSLACRQVRLTENIPYAHKFALDPIKSGDYVVKYGEIIGQAKADIQPGELVHRHNLEHRVEGLVLNWRKELRVRP